MKEIALTQGMVALVDDEDYDAIVHMGSWHAQKGSHTFYAARGRGVLMHRVIMDAPSGKEWVVDHINGNGLDNRQENLRLLNRYYNAANSNRSRGTSKYQGVWLDRRSGRWTAQTKLYDPDKGCLVSVHIGLYDSEEDAARAYDRVRREEFGDVAKPNLPQESLPEEDQRHLFD